MKETKIGLYLIVTGNILYIAQSLFVGNNSDISDFISGFLLGLSIAINLIGIVLVTKSMSKK